MCIPYLSNNGLFALFQSTIYKAVHILNSIIDFYYSSTPEYCIVTSNENKLCTTTSILLMRKQEW